MAPPSDITAEPTEAYERDSHLQTEAVANLAQTLDFLFIGLTTNDKRRQMTLEDALIKASPFPDLQSLIEKNAHKIVEIRKSGFSDENKIEFLKTLFGEEVEGLLSSTSEPEHPLSRRDIRIRAEKLSASLDTLLNEGAKRDQVYNREMDAFIEKITTNYTLRSVISFRKSLKAEFDQIPTDLNIENLQRLSSMAVQKTLDKEGAVKVAEPSAEDTLDQVNHILRLNQQRKEAAILSQAAPLVVQRAGDIGDTSLLVDLVLGRIEDGINNPAEGAATEAKALEVFKQSPENIKNLTDGANTAEIFTKADIPGGDILANLSAPLQQSALAQHFIDVAFELEDRVDAGTLQIGRLTADEIRERLAYMRQDFTSAGNLMQTSVAAQVRSAADALGGSVQGTDEVMRAYLEGVYRKILSPQEISALGLDHFTVALVNTTSTSLYPAVTGAGTTALNWLPGAALLKKSKSAGTKAAIEGGAVVAGGKGLLGFFRGWAISGSFFKGIVGKIIVTVFGGGPIGWIIAVALPAIGGFASRLIGNAMEGRLGVVAPFTTAVLNQFGNPTPSKRDGGFIKAILWFIGGVIFAGILLIVVIFGSIFGQNAVGLPKGGGASVSGYSGGEPPSEITEITTCPVDRGTITQRPNGGYSHRGRDAYDIGSVSRGQPIYAAHAGNVAVAGCDRPFYGCALKDTHPLWMGYGRFVVLIGRRQNGDVFYTHYAHMEAISPNVLDGKVEAGEVIGYIDSSGFSSGDHLHFEYRRQGDSFPYDLVPFLPSTCPFR